MSPGLPGGFWRVNPASAHSDQLVFAWFALLGSFRAGFDHRDAADVRAGRTSVCA